MRRLRRLGQKRALRWSEGVCVIEGPDLVSAALDAGVRFEGLFVDERAANDVPVSDVLERARIAGVRSFALTSGTLERIGDATSPQPLIAAVSMVTAPLESLRAEGLVLVLHDVRDPGNAGTLIRSADASGVSAVVFTGHSVDPFNPKTLRASAGSIFHVPVVVDEWEEVLRHMRSLGIRTFATVVRGGVDYRDVDFTQPCAVVIGNESTGLDEVVRTACGGDISITMVGRSESLNAGVAGSLIAFEALRQRSEASTPHRPLPSP